MTRLLISLITVALVCSIHVPSARAADPPPSISSLNAQIKEATDKQDYDAAVKLLRDKLQLFQGRDSELHAQTLAELGVNLRHAFQFGEAQKAEQDCAAMRARLKARRAPANATGTSHPGAPAQNAPSPSQSTPSESETAPSVSQPAPSAPAIPGLSDLMYAPKDISLSRQYPLILVLSPVGNPRGHMEILKPVADKYHWLLIGDDYSKNGMDLDETDPHIMKDIEAAKAKMPVDPSKIYACGLSGGAMESYYQIYKHPDIYAGVIANTGMMPFGGEGQPPMPKDYPNGKSVVMIASPADFRYQDMERNRDQLLQMGWAIKWIEFPGGHAFAPTPVYDAAVKWLATGQ